MKAATVIFILLTALNFCNAQNILNRNISLEVNRQRLDNVLEILSTNEETPVQDEGSVFVANSGCPY